ncbi:hypothetical protein AD951_10270 [Acetobacter malorum]|uniref:Uncharacterized protein n=1 Tax=Acetobacter malorum TaxID=178901 RepID=A0A149VG34_9PROT|nr:hypothetical protein AD951_10270 [Acetobacter malorum]KXV79126.1 hypothetical protein AD953_03375 [Acetobacter malorum]
MPLCYHSRLCHVRKEQKVCSGLLQGYSPSACSACQPPRQVPPPLPLLRPLPRHPPSRLRKPHRLRPPVPAQQLT